MPEAERAHSTPTHCPPSPLESVESVPSRRALLVATAGLLASGAAPARGAAASASENPDALLITMCDRIVATDEERERLESPYYDSYGSPPHVSEQTDAIVAEMHRLSEAVAEMQAATPEGLRAKARAMMAYACYMADGTPDWGNHNELLGWSLARDLLRGA